MASDTIDSQIRAKQEQLPVLAFGSLSWLRELRDAVEEQT